MHLVEAVIVAVALLAGFVILGSMITGSLSKSAAKIAGAVTDRPVPVPPVFNVPAAAAPARSSGVMVRWEEEQIEFTPEDASGIISELISDVFKDLTGQDKMLLKNIYRSHNSGNLHRLSEDFRRGSQEHQYYRRLRDSHLIRPVEGKFLPAVRIEMTEFGLAVIQRFPSLLESDDTGVGVPAIAGANA